MTQKWNDSNLPWQNTSLPWKNTALPWNDTNLPWKGGSGGGGTDPLAPGAPTSIEVVTPLTNPPSFDVGLHSGDGAPLDTAEDDVVEIGIASETVDYSSDPLEAADIIAGEVDIANGTLSAIARTPHARIKRPGAPDRYSAWVSGASYTVLTITSSNAFSAAENQTSIGTVTASDASTFAITGGADAALISIDSSTGVLTFDDAPDYESPGDAGGNNVYNIEVTATRISDSAVSPAQAIAVTVTDEADTGFSPADFGADLLLWLEADDLSTLFQNIAGSSAVSADGQTVGTWNDKSGDNFHLTAPADDTTRPTYNTSGGLHWVTFDGTNDVLRRTASLGMYAAGACSACFAVRGNPGTDRYFISEGRSSDNNPIYGLLKSGAAAGTTGTSLIRNDAGTALLTNAPSAANAFNNADHVITVVDAGSTVTIYIDGAAGSASASAHSGGMTLDRTALGALVRAAVGSYFAGRVYAGFVINRVLTTQERSDSITYMGVKAGLTL